MNSRDDAKRKLRHAVEVVPDAESLATRAAEWLIGQIAHADFWTHTRRVENFQAAWASDAVDIG